MDSSSRKVSPPFRRGYWASLAALAAALPAALAAHVWGDFQDWRALGGREPIPAQVGQPVDYAGARWTVTHIARLPADERRAVVLAEFQSEMPNPGALAGVPCEVTLSDGEGRKWQPAFLSDPVVRQRYPEAVDKPLCGGPTFAAAAPGKPAAMAATFSIPASAGQLTLSIALQPALPRYLSVSEPRT